MKTIYCIPGMGANAFIFERVKIEGVQIKTLLWKEPYKKETLQEYAQRMAREILEETPILLGVSFGAILVQEIAKIKKCKKVIVVSGIKSQQEFPFYLQFIKRMNIHKKIPLGWVFKGVVTGVFTSEKNKVRYKKYFSILSPNYLNWAIRNLIEWEQQTPVENVYHIHGENDVVFPIRKLKKVDFILPNSGHFVIFQKSQTINTILQKLL